MHRFGTNNLYGYHWRSGGSPKSSIRASYPQLCKDGPKYITTRHIVRRGLSQGQVLNGGCDNVNSTTDGAKTVPLPLYDDLDQAITVKRQQVGVNS